MVRRLRRESRRISEAVSASDGTTTMAIGPRAEDGGNVELMAPRLSTDFDAAAKMHDPFRRTAGGIAKMTAKAYALTGAGV